MISSQSACCTFLSTPSARRATFFLNPHCQFFFISIHALREEGDVYCLMPRCVKDISIHALREEGDTETNEYESLGTIFLSTPSARRATRTCLWLPTETISFLSTPSARRATPRPPPSGRGFQNFYPRPPRGGRRIAFCLYHQLIQFLSTPSARRATTPQFPRCLPPGYFYPRPPRGGRP